MLLATSADQKIAVPSTRAQSAFWCRACGAEGKLIAGFCSRCYSRRHWDKQYFAGLRAKVLERDGHACQLCTRPARGKRSILVHHRRPGVSKITFLISLCPACHARLHRTRIWALHAADFRNGSFAYATMLWRELHPGAPEQLALTFDGPAFQPSAAVGQPHTLELALG